MTNNKYIRVIRLIVLTAIMATSIDVVLAGETVVVPQKAVNNESLGLNEAFKKLVVDTKADTKNTSGGFVTKILIGDEMSLLNAAIAMNPVCILRIDLANRAALAILKELASIPNDQVVLGSQMSKVLDPLRQFFDQIQTYSFMVIPLIKESLFGLEAVKNASAEQRAQFVKESLLLQFFESKMVDVCKFFEGQIKTKEDLKKACSEILIFFADLRASFSDDTIKIYHEFLANLKKPKTKK